MNDERDQLECNFLSIVFASNAICERLGKFEMYYSFVIKTSKKEKGMRISI
jgi:hypothetical protein